MGFVSSLFVHKISLKHSRETAASNLFQASLLPVGWSANFIFHFEHNYGLLVVID